MQENRVSRRMFVVAGTVALPFLALRPLAGQSVRDKVICSIYPDGAPWDVPVGGSVKAAAQTVEPTVLSRRELTGELCQPFKEATHEILPPSELSTSDTAGECEKESHNVADTSANLTPPDKIRRQIGRGALAVVIVLGCASTAR